LIRRWQLFEETLLSVRCESLVVTRRKRIINAKLPPGALPVTA